MPQVASLRATLLICQEIRETKPTHCQPAFDPLFTFIQPGSVNLLTWPQKDFTFLDLSDRSIKRLSNEGLKYFHISAHHCCLCIKAPSD